MFYKIFMKHLMSTSILYRCPASRNRRHRLIYLDEKSKTKACETPVDNKSSRTLRKEFCEPQLGIMSWSQGQNLIDGIVQVIDLTDQDPPGKVD